MDLTTRCPSCGTVFDASLQELQLRKGYIRCVQCAHIFDGYAEVVSESGSQAVAAEPARAAAPQPPAAEPAPIAAALPGPQVFRAGRASREEPHFTVGITPDAGRGDPSAGPPLAPSVGRDPEEGGAPRAERIVIGEATFAPRGASRPAPFVVEPHPVRAGRGGSAAPLMRDEDEDGPLARLGRAFMMLVVGLLALLALAQTVYIYRSQIALAFPALRPAIERACAPLRCQVPYARDLSHLSISGSALRADAQAPNAATADAAHETERRFTLNVTLRNLGERPQEWPTLVLDLNDASGTRLVRRNLAPRDYLTPEQLAGPFAAHGDILVRVPLTVTGVQVNGYQLDLFYP
ncbi:zinc-ribbon and DUF3426 domain-containing protein [Castellaniella sp. GW247-6E4]|uniref:zinc-ribbon and DUF3426 domain-containing protein n=1 Tax=Castellaniella sp. GW247-6E4 TaxID=3140380 RepID=UPI003315069C